MLSESFLVSCGAVSPGGQKLANPTPAAKDASIAIHGLAPQANIKQIFKKSVAAPNSVTASNGHIFAAQADRAVVHVYSRERGNHECLVPFQEHITALTLTCDDSIVVMGTESGRLMLWETPTGRLVSTSAAHLQAITCVAASADSNFIVSGSADSSLHVWSTPSLLSFSSRAEDRSPVTSMTSHRAGISALAISAVPGPGAIAVSGSSDGTAMVFDYGTGRALRTFILADPPTSLVLDPADRGFFAGYDDGSVQLVDFLDPRTGVSNDTANGTHPLHTSEASVTPVQPPDSSRWRPSSSSASTASEVLSLALSWDGTTLISGHANGRVSAWNVGQRNWQGNLVTMTGPVTNVQALPVEGWPRSSGRRRTTTRLEKVTKPKFEASIQQHGDGRLPGTYTYTAQLVGDLDDEGYISSDVRGADIRSDFSRALMCASGFPRDLLEESLAEFLQQRRGTDETALPGNLQPSINAAGPTLGDFMPLEQDSDIGQGDGPKKIKGSEVPKLSLTEQNALLRKQVAALQRVQRITFTQLDDLRAERNEYLGKLPSVMERRGQQNRMDVDEPSAQLTPGAAELLEAEQEDAADTSTP